MEEILRAAYSRGSGDQIIKVLNNNKNILSTASENCLGGTSELLQACCVLGVEHFCALAYFLGVQSEHLQPLLFAPFMERALVFLDALSAPSSGAAQQLRNGESSKVVLCAISMVCRKLVDAAHSLGAARAVVLPLLRVMGTLCASPNTLTTLHSALMEAFVSAGMHERGYKYCTSNPIFKIDNSLCSALTFDALTYFYYAGLCCLAVKKYDQALSYLMDAVVLPSQRGLSAVTVAALKKAQITSMLINDPVVLELPKYTSYSVIRHFQHGSPTYDTLTRFFQEDNFTSLREYLLNEDVINELKQDGNFGLAKLLITALFKKRIRFLVPVFSKMSFHDVKILKFSDTDWPISKIESFVVQMCVDGEITAEINQLDATLAFTSLEYADTCTTTMTTASNSGVALQILKERMENSIRLNNRIRMIQSDLYRNPHFLQRKISAIKPQAGDDITLNPMVAEQDMMDMILDHDDIEDMY